MIHRDGPRYAWGGTPEAQRARRRYELRQRFLTLTIAAIVIVLLALALTAWSDQRQAQAIPPVIQCVDWLADDGALPNINDYRALYGDPTATDDQVQTFADRIEAHCADHPDALVSEAAEAAR